MSEVGRSNAKIVFRFIPFELDIVGNFVGECLFARCAGGTFLMDSVFPSQERQPSRPSTTQVMYLRGREIECADWFQAYPF